jgi:putative colanic acid biosynthesis acetyltransferase WcaF
VLCHACKNSLVTCCDSNHWWGMTEQFDDYTLENATPVIDLSMAPGEGVAWGRNKAIVYLWGVCELLFVTNPWQISSALRIRVLRIFGAEIGEKVTFRPRTRVKFPWKLHIGDHACIGEGVWIHNQNHVHIGSNAVVSQDAFITTGSHAVRRDMGLLTSPVHISDGVWVTSRSIILGGAKLGQSSIVAPNSVVPANAAVPANAIFGAAPGRVLGTRFDQDDEEIQE